MRFNSMQAYRYKVRPFFIWIFLAIVGALVAGIFLKAITALLIWLMQLGLKHWAWILGSLIAGFLLKKIFFRRKKA